MAGFKVGSFATPSATGNLAITGVGFQPKALIVFGNRRPSDGTAVDGSTAIGIATSSTAQASCNALWDSGGTQTNLFHTNLSIHATLDLNAAVDLEGRLVSFDADGFTINWINKANNDIVNYIALGADVVSNAKLVQYESKATTGDQDITGFGFQPEAVIVITCSEPVTPPTIQNVGQINVGLSAGGLGSQICAIQTSNTGRRTQSTNKFVRTILNAGGEEEVCTVSSFLVDGVRLNWSLVQGDTRFGWILGIKGSNKFFVGNDTTKTSTGTKSTTGVGFQPAGIFVLHWGRTAQAGVDSGSGSLGFGASSGASNEAAVWQERLTAGTNAGNEALNQTSTLIDYAAAASPVLNHDAELQSFDADGFTLNYKTAIAEANQFVFMAFGEPAAAPAAAAPGIRCCAVGFS